IDVDFIGSWEFTYGPWYDRRRSEVTNFFFPTDNEPASPAQPRNNRLMQEPNAMFISMNFLSGGDITLNYPSIQAVEEGFVEDYFRDSVYNRHRKRPKFKKDGITPPKPGMLPQDATSRLYPIQSLIISVDPDSHITYRQPNKPVTSDESMLVTACDFRGMSISSSLTQTPFLSSSRVIVDYRMKKPFVSIINPLQHWETTLSMENTVAVLTGDYIQTLTAAGIFWGNAEIADPVEEKRQAWDRRQKARKTQSSGSGIDNPHEAFSPNNELSPDPALHDIGASSESVHGVEDDEKKERIDLSKFFPVIMPIRFVMKDGFRIAVPTNPQNVIEVMPSTDFVHEPNGNYLTLISGTEMYGDYTIPIREYQPQKNIFPFEISMVDAEIGIITPPESLDSFRNPTNVEREQRYKRMQKRKEHRPYYAGKGKDTLDIHPNAFSPSNEHMTEAEIPIPASMLSQHSKSLISGVSPFQPHPTPLFKECKDTLDIHPNAFSPSNEHMTEAEIPIPASMLSQHSKSLISGVSPFQPHPTPLFKECSYTQFLSSHLITITGTYTSTSKDKGISVPVDGLSMSVDIADAGVAIKGMCLRHLMRLVDHLFGQAALCVSPTRLKDSGGINNEMLEWKRAREVGVLPRSEVWMGVDVCVREAEKIRLKLLEKIWKSIEMGSSSSSKIESPKSRSRSNRSTPSSGNWEIERDAPPSEALLYPLPAAPPSVFLFSLNVSLSNASVRVPIVEASDYSYVAFIEDASITMRGADSSSDTQINVGSASVQFPHYFAGEGPKGCGDIGESTKTWTWRQTESFHDNTFSILRGSKDNKKSHPSPIPSALPFRLHPDFASPSLTDSPSMNKSFAFPSNLDESSPVMLSHKCLGFPYLTSDDSTVRIGGIKVHNHLCSNLVRDPFVPQFTTSTTYNNTTSVDIGDITGTFPYAHFTNLLDGIGNIINEFMRGDVFKTQTSEISEEILAFNINDASEEEEEEEQEEETGDEEDKKSKVTFESKAREQLEKILSQGGGGFSHSISIPAFSHRTKIDDASPTSKQDRRSSYDTQTSSKKLKIGRKSRFSTSQSVKETEEDKKKGKKVDTQSKKAKEVNPRMWQAIRLARSVFSLNQSSFPTSLASILNQRRKEINQERNMLDMVDLGEETSEEVDDKADSMMLSSTVFDEYVDKPLRVDKDNETRQNSSEGENLLESARSRSQLFQQGNADLASSSLSNFGGSGIFDTSGKFDRRPFTSALTASKVEIPSIPKPPKNARNTYATLNYQHSARLLMEIMRQDYEWLKQHSEGERREDKEPEKDIPEDSTRRKKSNSEPNGARKSVRFTSSTHVDKTSVPNPLGDDDFSPSLPPFLRVFIKAKELDLPAASHISFHTLASILDGTIPNPALLTLSLRIGRIDVTALATCGLLMGGSGTLSESNSTHGPQSSAQMSSMVRYSDMDEVFYEARALLPAGVGIVVDNVCEDGENGKIEIKIPSWIVNLRERDALKERDVAQEILVRRYNMMNQMFDTAKKETEHLRTSYDGRNSTSFADISDTFMKKSTTPSIPIDIIFATHPLPPLSSVLSSSWSSAPVDVSLPPLSTQSNHIFANTAQNEKQEHTRCRTNTSKGRVILRSSGSVQIGFSERHDNLCPLYKQYQRGFLRFHDRKNKRLPYSLIFKNPFASSLVDLPPDNPFSVARRVLLRYSGSQMSSQKIPGMENRPSLNISRSEQLCKDELKAHSLKSHLAGNTNNKDEYDYSSSIRKPPSLTHEEEGVSNLYKTASKGVCSCLGSERPLHLPIPTPQILDGALGGYLDSYMSDSHIDMTKFDEKKGDKSRRDEVEVLDDEEEFTLDSCEFSSSFQNYGPDTILSSSLQINSQHSSGKHLNVSDIEPISLWDMYTGPWELNTLQASPFFLLHPTRQFYNIGRERKRREKVEKILEKVKTWNKTDILFAKAIARRGLDVELLSPIPGAVSSDPRLPPQFPSSGPDQHSNITKINNSLAKLLMDLANSVRGDVCGGIDMNDEDEKWIIVPPSTRSILKGELVDEDESDSFNYRGSPMAERRQRLGLPSTIDTTPSVSHPLQIESQGAFDYENDLFNVPFPPLPSKHLLDELRKCQNERVASILSVASPFSLLKASTINLDISKFTHEKIYLSMNGVELSLLPCAIPPVASFGISVACPLSFSPAQHLTSIATDAEKLGKGKAVPEKIGKNLSIHVSSARVSLLTPLSLAPECRCIIGMHGIGVFSEGGESGNQLRVRMKKAFLGMFGCGSVHRFDKWERKRSALNKAYVGMQHLNDNGKNNNVNAPRMAGIDGLMSEGSTSVGGNDDFNCIDSFSLPPNLLISLYPPLAGFLHPNELNSCACFFSFSPLIASFKTSLTQPNLLFFSLSSIKFHASSNSHLPLLLHLYPYLEQEVLDRVNTVFSVAKKRFGLKRELKRIVSEWISFPDEQPVAVSSEQQHQGSEQSKSETCESHTSALKAPTMSMSHIAQGESQSSIMTPS
ncbi:hypothetical protein ADUPG1_007898, partial [Aduncisulcus paluster]